MGRQNGIFFVILQEVSKALNMKTREIKRTKQQKARDWAAFLEKLRNTPREKLSKAAQWVLDNEEKEERYWVDMRAVLK